VGKSGDQWGKVVNTVSIGEHHYSIDPKHRVVAPPRFRDALLKEDGAHFIVAKGFDKCIWLFLPSQWEEIRGEFKEAVKASPNRKRARQAAREFFGSAVEAPVDEQGRILMPQLLMDYAGLRKDAVVVGVGSKAEIWDLKRWKALNKSDEAGAFEEMSEDLSL